MADTSSARKVKKTVTVTSSASQANKIVRLPPRARLGTRCGTVARSVWVEARSGLHPVRGVQGASLAADPQRAMAVPPRDLATSRFPEKTVRRRSN